MARRTIYVGGLEDLEQVSATYAGRLCSDNVYVFGRWCEATAEAALLWDDYHTCATKAKLTAKQRYACKEALRLTPLREIADTMGCSYQMVEKHLRAGFAKLDNLNTAGLGVFTTIVEECGGWRAVYHYLADLKNAPK